jgi:MoCo/4Fe-4S cofactor protein with predicted Tat translocation signal
MSSVEEKESKQYWRSLKDRAHDPEIQSFMEKEFQRVDVSDMDGVDRRRFMQVMGASVALASAAACHWDKKTILPFVNRPEDSVPGVAKRYTTAFELGGFAHGVTMTSYEGRPVKVEGNPKHPISHGTTTPFAQGATLELYDPDRSRKLLQRKNSQETVQTWANFTSVVSALRTTWQSTSGKGVVFLSEATSSPSIIALRDRLKKEFRNIQWVEYEAVSCDGERLGTAQVFGASQRPLYDLTRAKIIVSLDGDFLTGHPAGLRYAADFVQGRKPETGSMNRLYAIESRLSSAGAMADHRLPLRSEQIKAFVLALTAEIVSSHRLDMPLDVAAFGKVRKEGFLGTEPVQKFIKVLASDLLKHPGESALLVGGGQPSDVHALVHQLNVLLQNAGKTVSYIAETDANRPTHNDAIKTLVDDMSKGQVETLFILGGNPAYNAPGVLNFAGALGKVKNTVHISTYDDETSRLCEWHIPRAHALESWGDARAYDGTVSIVQPLIKPLYDGKSVLEALLVVAGDHVTSAHDYVKATFVALAGSLASEKRWRKALHDGVVENTAYKTASPARKPLAVPEVLVSDDRDGKIELTFWEDGSVYDGRFANNAWLQELPDFMTKLTWDCAALVGPKTARELSLKHETMVTIQADGREITLPVYVMPGQAPNSISLYYGYGRTAAGHVAGDQAQDIASVGFSVYPLKPVANTNFLLGATVKASDTHYDLAATQDHFAIDAIGKGGIGERVGQLIRETTLEEYKEEPHFAKHVVHSPPLQSLWDEKKYDNVHKWGMSIDLNTCTGCSACVVACHSENNIPVVGKKQVLKSREMHWIRIDRYFTGDAESPRVAYQPLTCHQCENAPCESVCPVAATTHSSEGLNDMAYNRCVGTRYCANNCPYKVRRFNYFNFNKKIDNDPHYEVERLKFNPEVTVRHRGVIEKCTYCVQRIRSGTNQARLEKRTLQDGDIVTACQQACPTNAISFGDLNDPTSVVAKRHGLERDYAMLAELNVKPRTHYLAKVRNPHPELS